MYIRWPIVGRNDAGASSVGAEDARDAAGGAAGPGAVRPPRREEGPPKPRRRRKKGQARLRPEQVELVVAALLTRPAAAKAAIGVLQPSHFSQEPHLRLVWECLLQAYETHPPGDVPRVALMVAIAGRAAASPASAHDLASLFARPEDVGSRPAGLDRRAVIRRPGILHRAYAEFRRPGASSRSGLRLLKRFLHERAVVEPAERVGAAGPYLAREGVNVKFPDFPALGSRIERLGVPLYRGFEDFPEDL